MVLRIADDAPVQVEIHSDESLGGVIGRSPPMRRLMAQVAKAAQGDVSVLVTGEVAPAKSSSRGRSIWDRAAPVHS